MILSSMKGDRKSELESWTLISLAMNIVLFVLKLITGMFVMSIAIISEAIDSGIDVAASSVARASAKKALQPPDEDHMYGHGKYENMGALTEAGLIIITAILIIYGAYYRLTHDFELLLVDIGIVVLLASIVAKVVVSRKMKQIASKHDSMVARAEALNLGTDVYMTTTVLIVLFIVRIGTHYEIENIELLDPVGALIVAGFIIWAAIKILRECSVGLVDGQLPDSEMEEIARVLESHKHFFVDYHRLRTRKSGATRMVDMHLVVTKDITVEEAHSRVKHLEDEISSLFPDTSVLIHMDPCTGICDTCDSEHSRRKGLT